MVQLWRRARRQRELPDPARLAAAREAVGWRHLELDPKTRQARLSAPNMRLDLGAIAKGFAADEALAVLRRKGIRRALVAGSGDMAFGDPPPGRKGWRIEVAPLDVPGAPASRFVHLSNCGIATSGDVFQHVEIAGIRYSHIVDPRTGVGLTDHSLVTVIAPDCMTADTLSTTVSVLGPVSGFALVGRSRGASAHEARVVDGKVVTAETPRFKRHERP
jgi:thiamine biosynthesis lipoprotein